MKHVVSVSLGSSKRDKKSVATLCGEEFTIERRGTDGDLAKFKSLVEELDGKVDSIGVGGADIWVYSGAKRYGFRQVLGLVKNVKTSFVVDGSGLKHTLEREAIKRLQESGRVDFKQERVLLVSAVDRYGMAQELDRLCPNVVYGDFYFGLGVPLRVTSYKTVKLLSSILLPIITKLPIQWFYPTGSQQDERKPKYGHLFDEATFICGDWHYIKRYAPDKLIGKTILTQTVRSADLEWLKTTGAKRVITTTPVIDGETFATNVMEGVVVALLGKKPDDVTEQEFLDVLKRLNWEPNEIVL